jgi:hypothetical protein
MNMKAEPIEITKDTPEVWEEFARAVDGFVPDPMILRAADVFMMGRSMAGDRAHDIWAALEKNISGILAFFDALVTHERIPFINYWQTFPFFVLENALDELAVRVDIQHPVYEMIHNGALKRLEEFHLESLLDSEIGQVEQELGAFDYDWQPDLGYLAIPPTQIHIAQFLLGGLIFGAYAAASQTDHVMQSKRSRLFVALSAPLNENVSWRYEKEQQLFERLHQACLTSQHVHVKEYATAPSVLPYLMSSAPRPTNPRELLDKALEFRMQSGGKKYREWFSNLREQWSMGINDPQAQVDVENVRKELLQQYSMAPSQSLIVRYDIGFDLKPAGIGPGVVVKDLPLELPEWLRRWFVENVRLTRHGKVLLRLSIAQRNYENLVMGLRSLWNSA